MNVIPPPPVAGVNGAGRGDDQGEDVRREAEVHAAVADGLLGRVGVLLRTKEGEEYLLSAGEAALAQAVAACAEAQLSVGARVAELTATIAVASEERGVAAPDRNLLESFVRGPRG